MPELPEVDPVVSFREYLCQVAGISSAPMADSAKVYYGVEIKDPVRVETCQNFLK